MSTSTAALIVSIGSAVFTLAGVAWQLTLYRLSGARLKVQLVFCYAEDGPRGWATTGRGPIRFADIGFDHPDPRGIEHGKVRVTNIGRTAVSVENISFDIRHNAQKRPRRHRHTVQPMQFRSKESDSRSTEPLDLSAPIRLEAGDNVTADFHLWPTFAHPQHGTASGPIRIRGSALAVGRKWSTRSPRRRAWNLPAGSWTMFSDVEVTPHLQIFRTLWEYNYSGKISDSIALLLHREIAEKLSGGGTNEDLEVFLDAHTRDSDDRVLNGLRAYDLHHVYKHGVPPLWPETPSQPVRPLGRCERVMWGQNGRSKQRKWARNASQMGEKP